MELDDEYAQLEQAFERARHQALVFIRDFNAKLPTVCPHCHDEAHIPGLRCPNCGYRHGTSWAILRDTEYGYEVLPITDRTAVLKTYSIE